MHEVTVNHRSHEFTPSSTETPTEDLMSADTAASAEFGAICPRVTSLETELTAQSEKIRAYRGWVSLALELYLFCLLFGPVLDALAQHTLPELRPHQYVLLIEPPCLWLLSLLLLRPSDGHART